MRQFILWLPVLFLHLAIFITSVTLGIDIPLSSIVQQTPLRDNCQENPTWKLQHKMSIRERRKTSTGSRGMKKRRTVLAVGAAAIPTLWTSRASKAVVWLSGLMLLVAGQVLDKVAQEGVI
jgi:hypothetical protein